MKWIFFIGCSFVLFSCTVTKGLQSGRISEDIYLTKVRSEKNSNPRKYYLDTYQFENGQSIQLKIEKNNIYVTPYGNTPSKIDSLELPYEGYNINPEKFPGYRLAYDFEYKGLPHSLRKAEEKQYDYLLAEPDTFKSYYFTGQKFEYSQYSEGVQPITLAFKYRRAQDSISSQLTTGVNLGFSYFFKETFKTFRPISDGPAKKPIGYRESSIQFGIAPFVGVTAIDLTPKNTNNTIEENKKVLGINYGALLTFGLNKLDFGVAVGCDTGLGDEASNWIYQNKIWFGAVLGLDIIQ